MIPGGGGEHVQMWDRVGLVCARCAPRLKTYPSKSVIYPRYHIHDTMAFNPEDGRGGGGNNPSPRLNEGPYSSPGP